MFINYKLEIWITSKICQQFLLATHLTSQKNCI